MFALHSVLPINQYASQEVFTIWPSSALHRINAERKTVDLHDKHCKTLYKSTCGVCITPPFLTPCAQFSLRKNVKTSKPLSCLFIESRTGEGNYPSLALETWIMGKQLRWLSAKIWKKSPSKSCTSEAHRVCVHKQICGNNTWRRSRTLQIFLWQTAAWCFITVEILHGKSVEKWPQGMNLIKATLLFLLIKQTDSFISGFKDRFMPGRSARHGGLGSKLWTDLCCSSRAAGFSSANLAKQPEGFEVWIVADPF